MVIFIAILVIAIPARSYSIFLSGYGLHFLNPQGTVWHGSADVIASGTTIGQLNWNHELGQLLKGKLGFRISMQNQSIQLKGNLRQGLKLMSFQGEVKLDQTLINPVLKSYELNVDGTFELHNLHITMNHQHNVDSLTGTVTWTGGTARYFKGDEAHSATFPELVGHLSTNDGDAELAVSHDQNQTKLLNARLEPDNGWLHIELSRHMLKLVEIPWMTTGDSNDMVLEISRKIYH